MHTYEDQHQRNALRIHNMNMPSEHAELADLLQLAQQ